MLETRQSKLDGIKHWLHESLGIEVEFYRDDARRESFFRVNSPNFTPWPVLRVSDEALDNRELLTVLNDLDQGQVSERLLADPTIPLVYTEKGEIALYASHLCHTCGERFSAAVVHCPACDHHYPFADGECGNCHLEWPQDAEVATVQ